MMRYPFESAEAVLLNKQIFETIYYAALEVSHSSFSLDLHFWIMYFNFPIGCLSIDFVMDGQYLLVYFFDIFYRRMQKFFG